jgi:hypothetical protein
VEGTAIPSDSGSTVRLQGGGELTTATRARGRVNVAVHPWRVQLADPGSCGVTDTVLSLRQDRGGLTIRLTRFTVHVPPGDDDHAPVREGSIVGLRVAPHDVHVLEASPGHVRASRS